MNTPFRMKVTEHAKFQYRKRIDPFATDAEIEGDLFKPEVIEGAKVYAKRVILNDDIVVCLDGAYITTVFPKNANQPRELPRR